MRAQNEFHEKNKKILGNHPLCAQTTKDSWLMWFSSNKNSGYEEIV